MISYFFAVLLLVMVALAGVAAYFRGEAAQVQPLRNALDLSLVAIQKQGEHIDALGRVRTIQDDLYAQATAERAAGVRFITIYREKQREDAKKDPLVAQWGATRLPDAVVDRLQRHDARYRDARSGGDPAGLDDGRNTGAGRAESGRNER